MKMTISSSMSSILMMAATAVATTTSRTAAGATRTATSATVWHSGHRHGRRKIITTTTAFCCGCLPCTNDASPQGRAAIISTSSSSCIGPIIAAHRQRRQQRTRTNRRRILPQDASRLVSHGSPQALSISRTTQRRHYHLSVARSDQQQQQQSCNDDDDDVASDEAGAGTTASEHYGSSYHVPVMVNECIDAMLGCRQSKTWQKQHDRQRDRQTPPLVFVDGTLGGGGHSAALLSALGPGDVVIGCDVDPDAIETASERLRDYMMIQNSNDDNNSADRTSSDKPTFIPVQSNFCDLADVLPSILREQYPTILSDNVAEDDDSEGEYDDEDGRQQRQIRPFVDGILLDLGVSSYQIDNAERGFAYQQDGPLDMRMTATTAAGGAITAADICNEFDETALIRILRDYGDEPRAKRLARAIMEHRPLQTTHDLVDAVASVTPAFVKHSKRLGRTATLARVFQSLRIVVNQEDRALNKALLEMATTLLRPGGRFVVMSYHSMEDRATKRAMRDGVETIASSSTMRGRQQRSRSSYNNDERDMYGNYVGPPRPFRTVGKRQKASEEEIKANSRARSATLRIAERQ